MRMKYRSPLTVYIGAVIMIFGTLWAIMMFNVPTVYLSQDAMLVKAFVIKYNTVETVYIYDENSELVFSNIGTYNDVLVPLDILENKTMIHNHPSFNHEFSKEDLKIARDCGVRYIYLSSPQGLNISEYPFEIYNYRTWKEIEHELMMRE